jgi:hypothetical protein
MFTPFSKSFEGTISETLKHNRVVVGAFLHLRWWKIYKILEDRAMYSKLIHVKPIQRVSPMYLYVGNMSILAIV